MKEQKKTKKELRAELAHRQAELEDIKKRSAIRAHIGNNAVMLFASVAMAYFLAASGILGELLTKTVGSEIISSFIAGIFFTSLFTAAPATIALGSIAQAHSLWIVALFGALGAVIGDLILYRVLKTHVTDDLLYLLSRPRRRRLPQLFHLKVFRWLLGFIGMLIIASPLPDELGLMLIGIGKLHPSFLMSISFVLNGIGIYIVGLIARQLI